MPVIVVGADTPPGLAILDGLHNPPREVRAFVSDEDTGLDLKQRGFKVALGDVSDEGHVEAASTSCFSAVLVAEAATDLRERAFAGSPQEVLKGWARAVTRSRVSRVIWVIEGSAPAATSSEVATVDPAAGDLVAKVVALDDAQTINTSP